VLKWTTGVFLRPSHSSHVLSVCRQYRVATAAAPLLLLLVMQGESLLVGLFLDYLNRRHSGLLFINVSEAVAQ
jgi:hypothetical protein